MDERGSGLFLTPAPAAWLLVARAECEERAAASALATAASFLSGFVFVRAKRPRLCLRQCCQRIGLLSRSEAVNWGEGDPGSAEAGTGGRSSQC